MYIIVHAVLHLLFCVGRNHYKADSVNSYADIQNFLCKQLCNRPTIAKKIHEKTLQYKSLNKHKVTK